MKLLRFLLTAALPLTLLLSGCEKSGTTTGDETATKSPIETFKDEVNALKAWAGENQKDPNDLAASKVLLGELIGKMKAVKTEGLPEDLAGAWNGALAKAGELVEALQPLGSTEEAPLKLAADPALAARLMTVSQEIGEAFSELQKSAEKHGITDLDLNPGQ